MNSLNFHLQTNLKYLRLKNKESQDVLGKVINKGGTAIGNYESGIRNPDYVDLYFIAKHYGISVDDLLTKDLRLDDEKYQPIPNKDFADEIANILKNSNLSQKKQEKILSDIEYYRDED